MIRGINRQIIEVCDTGNRYFERALLFVKPEYASIDDKMLKAQAHNLIRGYVPPYKRTRGYGKSQGKWPMFLSLLLAGAAAGVAVVLSFQKII